MRVTFTSLAFLMTASLSAFAACSSGDDSSAARPSGDDGPTGTSSPAPTGLAGCSGEGSCECSSGSCAEACNEVDCQIVCAAGASCQNACNAGGCEIWCEAGSDCTSACNGGNCTFHCEDGADCSNNCNGGGCTFDCQTGSDCTNTCTKSNCTTESTSSGGDTSGGSSSHDSGTTSSDSSAPPADASSSPSDSGGGRDGGIADGGGGASGCNAFANTAPTIGIDALTEKAPAPTGGTIPDGTYQVTAAVVYGAPVAEPIPGSSAQGTAKLSGATLAQRLAITLEGRAALRDEIAVYTFDGSSTIAGADTCPANGGGTTLSYSVTGTGFVVYASDQGATLTWTRTGD